MSIHRPKDHVEVYRIKAMAADIHEMSGRTGRPDLTAFVSHQILRALDLRAGQTVVDVGCGDGSLLRLICREAGPLASHSLTGILPTAEEVERLQSELRASWPGLSILQGLATSIPLPEETADRVVLNGVLLLLKDEQEVLLCLRELYRICKSGGQVFLGEVPDVDELTKRPYRDSITAWLWWVLRTQGAKEFFRRSRQVLRSFFGVANPFIIVPKRLFSSPPEHMRTLLELVGFADVSVSRHMEVQPDGQVMPSPTRWNYTMRKG
jgi:ubiquinone/menaquinone biosynthesis C-methylase UbiE